MLVSDSPGRQAAHWIDLAEYDLETARLMLRGRRYLYVGFMCHQAIEKALKAYIAEKTGTQPEFTHNLGRLLRTSDLTSEMPVSMLDTVDVLGPLNVEARYPTDKERLLRSMSKNRSASILQKTEELFEWIKTKLENL
jgi:HEPN domain-containing protein